MRIAWSIILILVTAAVTAFGQPEMNRKGPSSSALFADLLAYASSDSGKSRLDVYVQVPYEGVKFVRRDDDFVGVFDLMVTITTPEQEPVFNRVQTIEVRTKEFSQTTSNKFSSLKSMSFDLVPGPYDVRIEVRDQDSRTTATMRRKVLIANFASTAFSLSDVMLVNRLSSSGDKRTIVPNISGNVGDEADGFFLFCELYERSGAQPIRIVTTVQNVRHDSVGGFEQLESPKELPHQVFLKFQDIGLPIGLYLVRIDAYLSGGGPLVASASRTLAVRWSNIPFSITDIDKAVEQMRYIARDKELEYIQAGTTSEERRSRFLEFWLKRDPDPQTPRNELMEEYYSRVEYADLNFGHYLEGWRTDRGMIYIRYGAPDNIERHPFETSTRPFEIWRYYTLNYEYVFVDETGFGDYRLRYPATDLLGRTRQEQ